MGEIVWLLVFAALVMGPSIIASLGRIWTLGIVVASIVGLAGQAGGQLWGYTVYCLVLWFSYSVNMTRGSKVFLEQEWDNQELRRLGFDPQVVRSDPAVDARSIIPKPGEERPSP